MRLNEFLLARIAEDEALARAVLAEHEMWDWDSYISGAGGYDGSASAFATHFEPSRVVAECESKRRIIEWDDQQYVGYGILEMLALPYIDHPDFDPAWNI